MVRFYPGEEFPYASPALRTFGCDSEIGIENDGDDSVGSDR